MPRPKLPIEKKRNKRILIRFTNEDHKKIKDYCKVNEITVANYIRQLIIDDIDDTVSHNIAIQRWNALITQQKKQKL